MCEHNCWVRTPQAAKTETTKQKQQDTTQNFHFMSSVAISVHCCLHWCSHRHLASVFAPYIYPAILHRCSHLAFFLVCLSDGRTGLLFEFVCAIRTLISASSLLGVLPLHHVGYRPTGITISGSVGDIGGETLADIGIVSD